MSFQLRIGLLVSLCVVLLGGCSDSRFPPTAPVTGTVTVDGKPMERLSVTFYYQGKAARVGSGTTDAEGKFTISTFGKDDGALIGLHHVTIVDTPKPPEISEELKQKALTDPTVMYDIPGGMTGKPLKFTPRISKIYSKKDSSGLEALVSEEGPNEFVYELKK